MGRTPSLVRVEVDTDTAAFAAQVEPATIRDWHRRGYLVRYGTRRRAYWDLAEVYFYAARRLGRDTQDHEDSTR